LPFNETQVKIRNAILKNIPKEAEVSRIEFEGPRLAIYAKKPEVLVENSFIITDLVSILRKRIVIRSDPSVRLSEPKALTAELILDHIIQLKPFRTLISKNLIHIFWMLL